MKTFEEAAHEVGNTVIGIITADLNHYVSSDTLDGIMYDFTNLRDYIIDFGDNQVPTSDSIDVSIEAIAAWSIIRLCLGEDFSLERASQVASGISDLIIKKQKDYSKSNIKIFGEFGILVRLSDKFERLKNLSNTGKAPNFESVDDTYRDIAGYCFVWLMLRNDTFDLPMSVEQVAVVA